MIKRAMESTVYLKCAFIFSLLQITNGLPIESSVFKNGAIAHSDNEQTNYSKFRHRLSKSELSENSLSVKSIFKQDSRHDNTGDRDNVHNSDIIEDNKFTSGNQVQSLKPIADSSGKTNHTPVLYRSAGRKHTTQRKTTYRKTISKGIAYAGPKQSRRSDVAKYQRDAADPKLEPPTARILVTVMKRSRRYWEPWELNHNVCPPSLCAQNDEKSRPRGTGGSVFYNGDIVLDKESEEIIYADKGAPKGIRIFRRRKRATMKSSRTWKDGVVPFVFADDIAPKSKSVIRKAMKEIMNKTCITFRSKKLRDEDYIRFISEPGCWSMVGRVGGEQKVSIGRGCERVGIAVHEISHSLGFWHEQARPDRDKYVKILEENISPRYLADFNKADPKLVSSRGYPYDYKSIMHYSEKAFTNLGDKTIKVIGVGRRLKMKIGQRDELSNIDIAQLRDMYNCNDKEDDNATYCQKNWVKKGRSCYKFEDKMAEQFSGAARHCENLNSRLLHINDKKEDDFIKRYIKKKYPDVKAWRTGGRLVNGTFAWFTGDKKKPVAMTYTRWQKGHPASYSSMALVYNRQKNRVRWQGVWLGSFSQMPEHAYPVICERRARRKCIAGQYSDGRDYRGQLDHTIDGITCQKWSEQYPHTHGLLPYPYNKTTGDKDGLGDHNYCRNPSGDRKSRPWCYTTKKNFKWQYCDVSICSKKLQASVTIGGGNQRDEQERDTGRKKNNNSDGTNKNNRGSGGNKNNNDKRRGNKTERDLKTDKETYLEKSKERAKLDTEKKNKNKPSGGKKGRTKDTNKNNRNDRNKKNSKDNKKNNKQNKNEQNKGKENKRNNRRNNKGANRNGTKPNNRKDQS